MILFVETADFMKNLFAVVVILLAITSSYTSQEGVLPISSVVYQSDGIGESGPIKISLINKSNASSAKGAISLKLTAKRLKFFKAWPSKTSDSKDKSEGFKLSRKLVSSFKKR